jgi:hypothetical protein
VCGLRERDVAARCGRRVGTTGGGRWSREANVQRQRRGLERQRRGLRRAARGRDARGDDEPLHWKTRSWPGHGTLRERRCGLRRRPGVGEPAECARDASERGGTGVAALARARAISSSRRYATQSGSGRRDDFRSWPCIPPRPRVRRAASDVVCDRALGFESRSRRARNSSSKTSFVSFHTHLV